MPPRTVDRRFRPTPLVVAALIALSQPAHALAPPEGAAPQVASVDVVQQVQVSAHYANAVGTSDAAS
jgi:hypothetical protein